MSTARAHVPQPDLVRLHNPEEHSSPSGDLSDEMLFSRFHSGFFVRYVLNFNPDAEEKDRGHAWEKRRRTAISYGESVGYFIKLIGDLPVRLIKDPTLIDFYNRLCGATYRRGKCGAERPLCSHTVAKHAKQVDAVCRRFGPRIGRQGPYAGLVPEAPHLSISLPEMEEPKEPIGIDEARKIFAACGLMLRYGSCEGETMREWIEAGMPVIPDSEFERWQKQGRGDGGEGADDFWRAVVGTLCYTGFRDGTLRNLEWSMLKERRQGWFWHCPGRIMKNGKRFLQYVRPELLALYERMPRKSDKVFHWEHSDTHFRDRHKTLQRMAGVPPRSLHAWRRCYADSLVEVGANNALRIAQFALDHQDPKTTEKFYTKHMPRFIRKLPSIFPTAEPQTPTQGTAA